MIVVMKMVRRYNLRVYITIYRCLSVSHENWPAMNLCRFVYKQITGSLTLLFCRVYSSFSILTFVYHVTLFVNKQAQIHSRPIFMRHRHYVTVGRLNIVYIFT